MNAVEKATSIAITSKIAATASLLRSQMPYARIDFSPWVKNELTLQFEDQQSIDLSVSLPQFCPKLQCCCMLLQVSLPGSASQDYDGEVEVEFSGYGLDGTQQWHFATEKNAGFSGQTTPAEEGQHLIKSIVQRVLDLFPSYGKIDSRKAS